MVQRFYRLIFSGNKTMPTKVGQLYRSSDSDITFTPAPENVYTNSGHPMPFCFQVRSLYEMDGCTDRQTDRWAKPVILPSRIAT